MQRNQHSREFKEQALSKARARGLRTLGSLATELNMFLGTLKAKLSANPILAPSPAMCWGGYAVAATALVPGSMVTLADRQLCGRSCARSRFVSLGKRSKTSLR